MRALQALLLVVAATLLSGCGYNTIQVQDEATKTAASTAVQSIGVPMLSIADAVSAARVTYVGMGLLRSNA